MDKLDKSITENITLQDLAKENEEWSDEKIKRLLEAINQPQLGCNDV